jgi:hypothetical protein
VVSELGRKAYWCGDMRLCVVRWSMSCLFMRVSNIFPIMGRSDMGRKFAGRCVILFLGRAIALVVLRMSGYMFWCRQSLIREHSCGARVGAISLRIAGEMSKMSDAVLGSRWAIMCSISDGVVGASSNCGGGLGFGIGGSDREGSGLCLCGGMWFIVFCPTVMKWWLRQFAIEVSFVCVLFSYSMMEGEMVGVLFCGRCLFIVCHIFLGLL